MGRQRKNLIMLIAAVLLLSGLGGVYYGQMQSRRYVVEDEPLSLPTNIVLIDRTEADIDSVRFTSVDGHDMTLFSRLDENGDIEWAMTAAPEVPIFQTTAREMIRAFHYLSAEDQVFETVENPAEYGIGENITGTATYKDGTTATIYVGKLTPSHERFYMMLEGDPGLYLLYTYFGNRYLNTANDLIDAALPQIVLDGAEYLLIHERGSEPIEFAFYDTDEEKEALYERFGMINITMVSPYPGRDLYYTSLERQVMDDFNARFKMGELVDLYPTDYTQYGLDEPSLEFAWVGIHQVEGVHLLFGDRTDDGRIYVKQSLRPEVFLADYDPASNLFGLNPFLFIERFVAMVDILDVEDIVVEYPSIPARNWKMVINHEFMPPDDNWVNGRDAMFPTINGIEVAESDFKSVYRLLIGLTSDMEIDLFEPEDPPVFTVTFNMRDGSEPVITEYYLYEVNFFAMSRDGGPCIFVTSRQATDVFFKGVEDLLGH